MTFNSPQPHLAEQSLNLNAEQIQDAEVGLSVAIKLVKKLRSDAENNLIDNRAKDYEDYLRKFLTVKAYSAAIDEMEKLKKQGKDMLK